VSDVKYPKIHVKLTSTDGNVFGIIGKVQLALKGAGLKNEAKQFAHDAMELKSYDEVLRMCMETVDVQ
jgi:hypothetical protein